MQRTKFQEDRTYNLFYYDEHLCPSRVNLNFSIFMNLVRRSVRNSVKK